MLKNKIDKKMEIENDLAKNVQALTKQMEKSNSFWRSLGRGVVFGIGSAIGASIIAAIIVGTLSRIVHSVKDIPGLFK